MVSTEELVRGNRISQAYSLRTGSIVKSKLTVPFTILRIYQKIAGADTPKKGTSITWFAEISYREVDKDVKIELPFRDAWNNQDIYTWIRSGDYEVVGYDASRDSLLAETWRGSFHIGYYQHYGNGKIYWVTGLWLDASSPKDAPRYTVTYTPRYPAAIDTEGFSRDALNFFGYKWLDDQKKLVRRFEYLGKELPRTLSE